MSYALTLAAASFFAAVIWGGPLISLLRARSIGKQIRIEGPASHLVKTGTPTMGGLMILGPVIVITAALIVPIFASALVPLGMMVAMAALGAIDDLHSLARERQALGVSNPHNPARPFGLMARHKFLWQVLIATMAAVLMHLGPLNLRSIAIPGFPEKFDIGLGWIPIAVFIIVGTANAVNLTDGLDGLAGGTAAIAFFAWGFIAFLQGQIPLMNFSFTMVGALLAFLWFNAHPAQLIMGDTGSMALGGTLAVVALMTGQYLLLPLICLIFVAEAGSVILQVGYFKLTKGRRLFKMAPLHHHFELMGWSEVQTVQRFWLISMLAAMLGIALALL